MSKHFLLKDIKIIETLNFQNKSTPQIFIKEFNF